MTFDRGCSATSRAALLCDRDGTLVVDEPYNDDPDAVVPLPGAADALDRARRAGIRLGIVTNQRGVALGLISPPRLLQVHQRVQQLLGPFDVIVHCPHDIGDRCACRKPRPGLVLAAAHRLGVAPESCSVVGDSWTDVEAARGAGATAILIDGDPGGVARDAGDVPVVTDIAAAVDLVLERCVPA